jgi:mannitol-1-/sugar-/sorbitol-6-phosphatase
MTLDLTVGAVLLDMDGTLVDSTAVVEAMWSRFAAEHGLDPAVLIPASHGRQTIDTMRGFLPDLDPAEVSRLERAFSDEEVRRTEGIVQVPGAAALVVALAGLPVAVVTSASRALATSRMGAAGVPVPATMVTPADITRGKPDPQGYQHAAGLLDVPIEDCVIFEDAEAGIAAARASGAHVVVVGTHESALTDGLPRVPDLRGVRVTADAGRIRLTA